MKNKLGYIDVFLLLLCTGIGAIVFTGCTNTKETDPEPGNQATCNITQSQFVGTWIPSTIVVSPQYDYGNGLTSDGMAHWEQCQKDNRDQFLSNGVYVSDDGQDTCSSRHHEEGTWQYDDQNCEITTTVNGETEKWELISVSSSELKAAFRWTESGKNYTETWTFDKL